MVVSEKLPNPSAKMKEGGDAVPPQQSRVVRKKKDTSEKSEKENEEGQSKLAISTSSSSCVAGTDTATDSSKHEKKKTRRGGKGRKRNNQPKRQDGELVTSNAAVVGSTTLSPAAHLQSLLNTQSSRSSESQPKKRRNKRKGQGQKETNVGSSDRKLPDAVSALLSSASSLCTRPTPSSASASLSAEGMALLADLTHKSSHQPRTGKISMHELMGSRAGKPSSHNVKPTAGQSILQRLGGNIVDPESILGASIRQMPLVPGFPSLTHRPDSGPFSTAFRPELFKTTMEAYASAAMQCGADVHGGYDTQSTARVRSGRNSRGGSVSPDQLLPWINFAPMFPLGQRGRQSPPNENRSDMFNNSPKSSSMPGSSYGTAGGFSNRRPGSLSAPQNQQQPQNGFRNSHHQPPIGPPSRTNIPNNAMTPQHQQYQGSGPHQMSSNQKTRKPYFMPYLSNEAASRGLSNGDLIKGSLRVNQRNYEESYVDNPEGDDQLDLLILGVHDRNRALHGDVVVVRVKERINWVVRDNLYQAWRAGHLNVSRDDNGQPLTIPPLHEAPKDDLVEVAIGGMSDLKISKTDLAKSVPLSSEKKYERDDMVLIGAQLEVARKNMSSGQDAVPCTSACQPIPPIQSLIDTLSISRAADPVPAGSSPRKGNVQAKRVQNHAGKRVSYRILADMPDEDWGVPDVCLQKTAEVVYISDPKNRRTAMGQLKVMTDGNRNWALFSPTDSRMPRMMIPAEQVPNGFFDRAQDFSKYIFVARMMEWQATAQFARGRLERTLGLAGDIEAETEGLLFANDVDTREFSHAALDCLPITEASEWKIHEKEYKYRKDLREEIIFTIDPKTARDLDDALHINRLEDIDGKGTPGWEVGVHIADVTHFVLENTELDSWAASRATSVYLVHKVIPMLPRILCEQLCSLNSGVDRLTFSVIWKMDDEANIISEWFGRTVIRSKVKLAYEHAQDFIEGPEKVFEQSAFPPICDDVPLDVIKQKVLNLNEVALKLRSRRMEGGALRLDQPKLKFVFDDETKLPNGVSVYQIKDSNKLVEEFMLLANMAVARKIESAYPETSLLRRHPPPKQKVLREVLEVCEKIGFPLNGSSSGLLSSSLNKYNGDKQLLTSINQVLSMLMMKPMQLAKYFCTGSISSPSMYAHYALNTPYYTHFTSPIRRYPDVMVHRQLAAALGYSPPTDKTVAEIEKQAEHCNDKKSSAKAVSEASDDTFFGLFVKQCGPIEERGVVVNVLDASFDVLVFKYGVIKRVYVNRLDMARDCQFREGPPPKMTLYWNSPVGRGNAAIEQTIQMCTVVDVVLTALPEPTKYQAVIRMRPNEETHTLLELLSSDKDLE